MKQACSEETVYCAICAFVSHLLHIVLSSSCTSAEGLSHCPGPPDVAFSAFTCYFSLENIYWYCDCCKWTVQVCAFEKPCDMIDFIQGNVSSHLHLAMNNTMCPPWFHWYSLPLSWTCTKHTVVCEDKNRDRGTICSLEGQMWYESLIDAIEFLSSEMLMFYTWQKKSLNPIYLSQSHQTDEDNDKKNMVLLSQNTRQLNGFSRRLVGRELVIK